MEAAKARYKKFLKVEENYNRLIFGMKLDIKLSTDEVEKAEKLAVLKKSEKAFDKAAIAFEINIIASGAVDILL